MKSQRQQNRNQGAILLLVLGMIMLLSSLVVIFLKNLSQEMQVKSQLAGDAELKHYAYNALNVTWSGLEEILAVRRGLFSPLQGWPRVLEISRMEVPQGISINVNIEDESGKIALNNNQDKKLLMGLFGLFGNSFEAQELMQAYLQWLRRKPVEVGLIVTLQAQERSKENATKVEEKNNGKANNNVEKRSNNGKQRLSTGLNNYQQLAEIEVFRKRFFEGKEHRKDLALLKKCTTLWGTTPVNINTASLDVLKCLNKAYPMDLEQLANFLGKSEQFRGKAKYYKSLREINDKGHANFTIDKNVASGKTDKKDKQNALVGEINKSIGVNARTLLVEVEVKKADVSFLLSAIFNVCGSQPANSMNPSANSVKKESAAQKNTLTDNDKTLYNQTTQFNKIKGVGLDLVLMKEGRIEW